MEARMLVNLEAQPETKKIESDYYVEGYATTFEPYKLFTDDRGQPVYEQVARDAFKDAKMDDVILQYDHEGRVFARQSNGTLGLEVKDDGLLVWADLSKTEAARQLYEDIKAGMITKMSWRFKVSDKTFDRASRTIHINKVKEVFDVSAVSIPANGQTSISARKMIDEDERKREKLRLKLELGKD